MPLTLVAPQYKTYILEKTDETYGNAGEPTTVTVRQATQAQHRERQDLFATLERKFRDDTPGEVSLIQTLSFESLKELEVWLCLVECNLLDEDGKSILFPSRQNSGHPELALTKRQFVQAWGKLFPDIAAEIHSKVLDINPLWRGAEGEDL